MLIRGYALEWSQDGKKWSEWRDGGQTQAEFSIGSGRCDVTVGAVLHTGPNVSAHITIPQRRDGGGGERHTSAGPIEWLSKMIIVDLILVSLHRTLPSSEAAVRRHVCSL